MRRALVIGVLASLLSMLTAAPASAERPEVSPPESVEFDELFSAGFPCTFPMGAHLEGKQGAILFEDRAILTSPGLSATLTNLESGSTVALIIPGAFHDTILSDTRIQTKAVGRSILFGFFDGQPGMFLTMGKIVFQWDVTDPLSFDVIESESPGTMIDVCEMLAD
ncbi:MAG TPA: hypothetical protein VFZ06_11195 [Acidimicrobiia bacterium]|nr:hypothetical protein [Acidimicrobiia bacterium]